MLTIKFIGKTKSRSIAKGVTFPQRIQIIPRIQKYIFWATYYGFWKNINICVSEVIRVSNFSE